MIRAYRICQEKWAANAFDGEGARRYGGRWNAKGTSVIYLASSVALAEMEILVNLDDPRALHDRYAVIPVDFSEDLVESIDPKQLPDDWTHGDGHHATMRLGTEWAMARRSLVLRVPSVPVPFEVNYVVNPLHPDFSKLVIGIALSLQFDERLFPLFP